MLPAALRKSVRTLVSAAVLTGTLPALAQSPEAPPPPPEFAPPPPPPVYAPPPPPYAPPPYPYPQAPYPPQQPLPPNVGVAPGGHVSVTRTPEQGVDVHAQTTAGTVHAYGCDRVTVDPRTRAVYPSCGNPYGYSYGPPMPYYAPPPVYGHPGMYGPPRVHVVGRGEAPDALDARKSKKPRYAPDPGRTGALIASSLVFGLGTAAAGTAYLGSLVTDGEPSTPALVAMGLFLTAPPSVPRFVVGQVGMGLLWTALRGGSFALGTMVDWDDDTYMLPATLAFIVPLTLGIVDLATTPHREQLEPKRRHHETAGFTLHGIGPTALPDHRTGSLVPAVGALGSF